MPRSARAYDPSGKCARAVIVHNHNILLIKRNRFGDKYYTLPGGHIKPGETAEVAAARELYEETSIVVKNLHLVFIDQPSKPYDVQYVFVADYADGDVGMRPDSDEIVQNETGQNTYQPLWVPVSKLARLHLVSPGLKQALLAALRDGFPQEPKGL